MILKIKCNVPGCDFTGWYEGWEEQDTNSAGINDSEPMDDACEHIKAGGDYTIVDSEYESDEDDWGNG